MSQPSFLDDQESAASPEQADNNGGQPLPYSIIHKDFAEWVKDYSGTPFNFLHCDFPYGIGHDKSAQGGTATGRWAGFVVAESLYIRHLHMVAVGAVKCLIAAMPYVGFCAIEKSFCLFDRLYGLAVLRFRPCVEMFRQTFPNQMNLLLRLLRILRRV